LGAPARRDRAADVELLAHEPAGQFWSGSPYSARTSEPLSGEIIADRRCPKLSYFGRAIAF
jgi:hypothetical protein